MSSHSKRIAALVTSGAMLIGFALVARKYIIGRRAAAQKSATSVDQTAAEHEIVTLLLAAKNAPKDKQKQWDLANGYIKYGILTKAADQLALIMHLDPSDTNAQMSMADVSLLASAYPTAEFYYRLVTQEHPSNIPAWQGLAASFTFERRFFEAMNVAKHAIELNPVDTRSRLIGATALLNYALQYPDPRSHAEYIQKAEQELAPLAKVMPENGEVFYEYGRALMGEQRRAEAVSQLERAVALQPDNSEASTMLALAYRSTNHDDKALRVVQTLLSKIPADPSANDLLGQLLMASNKPGSNTEALEAFKKAVLKAPSDQYILERLGEAYQKADDLEHAREIFERVTQINPNRSFAFQSLALIYTRLGDRSLAKQAATYADHIAFNENQFKRIQELSSKHPTDVNLHLMLGDRFLAIKMYAPARDEYFMVLKLDPNNKRVPQQFMKEEATKNTQGLY